MLNLFFLDVCVNTKLTYLLFEDFVILGIVSDILFIKFFFIDVPSYEILNVNNIESFVFVTPLLKIMPKYVAPFS